MTKLNINKINIKNKKYFWIFICIILFISVYYIIYNRYKNTKENFNYRLDSPNIFIEPFLGGFFACTSHIMSCIVFYYNNKKVLPDSIDSSQQFGLYKPSWVKDDITYHFFKNPNEYNNNIEYKDNINYSKEFQFNKYSNINYISLQPFIEKYFSPSQDIINIQNQLIDKYNINVDQYCAVYYRGTDKKEETTIGSFDTYIDKMNEMLNTDNNIKFIIQSDNQNFIDTVKSKIQNCISFDENVASYTDKGIHNENTPDDNYIIMKNFLAIVFIMSKCKYIICSSGNCSIWMMYFRGNGKNVKQFLNNEWL